MFSIQQLKYFCEAYRLRSLNRAADELFLTRQALSKSLAALEREIGGQLFDRGTDGVQPTALAEAIYPEADALVERSEALFGRATRQARDSRYTLRVGSTFGALETTFPLLPIAFGDAHPNIELTIAEAPDLELEALVAHGQLDGAFVIGPATPRAGLSALCLHREGLGLLMRPDHALAGRASLDLADVTAEPLLVVGPQFKVHRQLEDAFARRGLRPTIRHASSDFSLLAKMCEMGEGLVPLPVSRRTGYEASGLVLVPLDAASDPGWQIDFVCREGEGASYALATFVDYLRTLG